MPEVDLADCWFLTGATASGKSAVGVELARRLGGEILSLDSMAVYRGLDIGVAKPAAAERRAVPHHLIDLVEPDESFSLADYLDAAAAAVADVRGRGRAPVFVGGTPLYLKGLLRGVFAGPPADWSLRGELQAVAERDGPAALHARLAQVDPTAAGRLSPQDTRRVIRALEVWIKTSRPISDWQRQFERPRAADQCRAIVLEWPRAQLCERIDARVDAMFAAGLIAEIRALLAAGQRFGRTAGQALGYRETLEHLAGERDLAGTIALVKTRTRQFAKRQATWFRSLGELQRLPVDEPFDPAEVAERVAALGG